MPQKLGISKVDSHGRAQIPVAVRRYLDITKDQGIAFWMVEERVILEKLGAGTPNPFEFPARFRGIR